MDAWDELLRDAVQAVGLEYVGYEYHPQGKHSVLRVYIDKPGGVTIDDCGKASKHISAVLDVEDPVPGKYSLEVSSPGFERPLFTLEQCQQVIGQCVKIHLAEPLQSGQRKVKGTLSQVEGANVVIDVEGEQLSFPFATIKKAKLCRSGEL